MTSSGPEAEPSVSTDRERLFSSEHSDIADRVNGLRRAVDAARGRMDDDLVDEAAQVVDRADERLRLSADHTIVAFAGATGSGKSSLFNHLAGLDLAAVGVRRPTTSWALACAWGPEGAGEILEWIGIPARHQVSRMSKLDSADGDTSLQGLVLLDLPDHDSTEVAHHLEVDRLVSHADLLVWILDPQKYADAVVHERYLRPLAPHSDVMVVVLNQMDLVPVAERDRALADVRRLLTEDGLADVPLLGVSAARGDGLDELTDLLAKRIAGKQTAKQRLQADVRTVTDRLAEASGTVRATGVSEDDRQDLNDRLAECAGVPVVVDSVERSVSRRAARASGWPIARWFARLRTDPLQRLDVESDLSADTLARTSVPEPTKVGQAGVDAAVRELGEKAGSGLTAPWARAVRGAALSQAADLTDAVDQSVVGTDLRASRPPLWARLAGLVQWLLLACAVAGLGWLVGLGVTGLVASSTPPVPDVLGVPLPTVLLVGGIVVGLAVFVVGRIAARSAGRRRAERADNLLRGSIEQEAQERVIDPMRAELETYEACRTGLLAAQGRSPR